MLRLMAFLTPTILLLSVLHSAPIPALDLDKLTADSNLIVMGEVVSVQVGGTTYIEVDSRNITARLATATVRVDQILKGTVPPGTLLFQYYVPIESIGYRQLTTGMYSALFFKAGTSSGLEFTSPYYPSAPAVPGTQVSGTTPIDRVVSAITGVISSPRTTLEQKRTALFALSHSRSASSTEALHYALGFADDTLRLTAAFALLERNDLSAMPTAKEALLQGNSAISPEVLHNLTVGIAQGVTDPKAVTDLAELLRSASVETRRAAATALMRTHSQDAITPLLSVLADPDREVRYYGVAGLAEIAGQLNWRPNMDDFNRDERRYLDYWREWGQTR